MYLCDFYFNVSIAHACVCLFRYFTNVLKINLLTIWREQLLFALCFVLCFVFCFVVFNVAVVVLLLPTTNTTLSVLLDFIILLHLTFTVICAVKLFKSTFNISVWFQWNSGIKLFKILLFILELIVDLIISLSQWYLEVEGGEFILLSNDRKHLDCLAKNETVWHNPIRKLTLLYSCTKPIQILRSFSRNIIEIRKWWNWKKGIFKGKLGTFYYWWIVYLRQNRHHIQFVFWKEVVMATQSKNLWYIQSNKNTFS